MGIYKQVCKIARQNTGFRRVLISTLRREAKSKLESDLGKLEKGLLSIADGLPDNPSDKDLAKAQKKFDKLKNSVMSTIELFSEEDEGMPSNLAGDMQTIRDDLNTFDFKKEFDKGDIGKLKKDIGLMSGFVSLNKDDAKKMREDISSKAKKKRNKKKKKPSKKKVPSKKKSPKKKAPVGMPGQKALPKKKPKGKGNGSKDKAFQEAIKDKKFKSPKSGREVKYKSLPSDTQKKIYKDWKKSQKKASEQVMRFASSDPKFRVLLIQELLD